MSFAAEQTPRLCIVSRLTTQDVCPKLKLLFGTSSCSSFSTTAQTLNELDLIFEALFLRSN